MPYVLPQEEIKGGLRLPLQGREALYAATDSLQVL